MPQTERMQKARRDVHGRQTYWRKLHQNNPSAGCVAHADDPESATCAHRTARGNHFATKAEAKVSASRLSREFGEPIVAYRCRICRQFHVRAQSPAKE